MLGATRVKTRLAVALTAAAMLATTACSSSTDGGGDGGDSSDRARYEFGFVGDQDKAGDPKSGGTLNVADYAEPRSLDPSVTYATGDSGGNAMAAIYDVLMRYDSKSEEHEPQLAKSLESSDDLKTWTLTLRDGVTFHDGTPMDAKAVIGSIGHYMENRGADTALLAPNIEDMTPKDDSTVVFTMRNAWSSFPSMLAQAAGMILAPAAYAGGEFKAIGAGPYSLDSYKPQESLNLTAFPDYWDGKPKLDGVRFFWPMGDDAILGALKDKSADVGYVRNPLSVDQAMEDNTIGFLSLSSMGNMVQMNSREGFPAADVRVRKAIALALDPQVDYQRAYQGKGLPGNEMFPKESRWATDTEPVEIDEAAAKKLVEEAKAEGFDGTIRYIDGTDPDSRAESTVTKALLERVGFTVKLDLVASIADQIQKVYVDKDFDLSRSPISVSESDPYHRLVTNLQSELPTNAGGYSNPEMDAALDKLREAKTDDEKQTVLDEMQTIWNETQPMAVVGASAAISGWQENVYGIEPTAERMVLLGGAWKG